MLHTGTGTGSWSRFYLFCGVGLARKVEVKGAITIVTTRLLANKMGSQAVPAGEKGKQCSCMLAKLGVYCEACWVRFRHGMTRSF